MHPTHCALSGGRRSDAYQANRQQDHGPLRHRRDRRHPRNEVQRALFLDVVVSERSPIVELFASEDQALLVRGDALLVLDLRLHILDGVARLHLKSDRLAGERLYEDLHREGWLDEADAQT